MRLRRFIAEAADSHLLIGCQCTSGHLGMGLQVPTFHEARFRPRLQLERVMLWTVLNGENEDRRWHSKPGLGAMSEIAIFATWDLSG